MDLLGGSSLWEADVARVPHSVDSFPRTADIVVVGGGITGALVTHSLVEKGYDVVVLDKAAHAGVGSTLASTAILQFEFDEPLRHLITIHGKASATEVYKASYNALEKLCKLCEQCGPHVEFARRPALYIATKQADLEGLRRDAELLNKEGVACEVLSPSTMQHRFPFGEHGALFHAHSAQVNPVRITTSLFYRAQEKGARIFYSTKVLRFETAKGGSVSVLLSGQRALKAKRVIVASGYESFAFIRPPRARLTNSYAAATSVCARDELWDTEAVIWETARPYHYLRTTPGPRILIGGKDIPFRNSTLRDAFLPFKSYLLGRKLRSFLKNRALRLEYAWAGTFGESNDGLPFLGEADSLPGVFFIIGCGGNGITLAMLASEIVSKWLNNESDTLLKTLALDR